MYHKIYSNGNKWQTEIVFEYSTFEILLIVKTQIVKSKIFEGSYYLDVYSK